MTRPDLRRLIHASSSLVLLAVLVSWELLRYLLLAALIAMTALELARLRSKPFREKLYKLVPVYRATEEHRVSGAGWLTLGYAVASWFPLPAPIVGILAGALADPAASAIGSRWGGAREVKTLPGTLAALAATFVLCAVVGLAWPNCLAAGITAAALERWPVLDDNLVVAPGVAAVVWVLS
ncbi:MAG: hypothetical protein V3R24_05035 [Gemmatimonadales bacterium]